MTLPRGVNSVASCTPACSRSMLSAAMCSPAGRTASEPAMTSAFLTSSLQQVVERGAAEVEAAFERFFDAHVEPRLDALGDELHRHAVDQRARQHRHQREQHHQPQRQFGAEHAGLEFLPQREQLVAQQRGETHGEPAVQREQQRIVLREQRGVGARGRQQIKRDRADHHAHDQQVGDGAALQAPGRRLAICSITA